MSTQESPPRFLFTYGTLRPSLATGECLRLLEGLEVVGAATVMGRLFDLGTYPGLVAGTAFVQGELLRITEASRLSAIDAYEGCDGPQPLYVRECWTAIQPDGSRVRAWVYVYVQPLEKAAPIPSGDYAEFLASGVVGRDNRSVFEFGG